MKKVDHYLLKQFVPIVLWSLIFFLIVILASDFIEKLKYYLSKHIAYQTILRLYLLKAPGYVYQILPTAILFSTLYLFSHLSRSNEYIAFKSAGLSLLRLATPIIIMGFLFSVFAFFLHEFVITKINYEMRVFKEVNINGNPPPKLLKNRYDLDIRTSNNYILHINKLDGEKYIMHRLKIIKLGPNSEVIKRWDAELAVWSGGKWLLKNCVLRKFKGSQIIQYSYYNQIQAPFSDPPNFFTITKMPAQETNFIKYKSYIAKLKKLGFNTREERVFFNFKFSYPLINVVVVLLAIPFSIIMVRGTLGLNVGFSILFSFLFYIYLEFFKAMGINGKLSPEFAAWFPVISVFICGIYLIKRKN